MTMNFGGVPVRASFTLSSDADFYQKVKTSDGSDFPATTIMELRWLNADDEVIGTWSATVSGATAEFRKDKTDVATLLDLNPDQARLFYEDGAGGPELLLAQGNIHNLSP